MFGRSLAEARHVGHGQAMRIRETEQSLREEEERTDAFRQQLHETQQHFLAMKRQMRERVWGIMLDCEALLDMIAETPPRAIGPEPMDEVDTLGSVGDWGPRGGV